MARGVKVRGDKIRRIREEKFYSQEEFAQALGMGVRNLHRIEKSETAGIGYDKFRKLADLVKLPIAELAQKVEVELKAAERFRNRASKEISQVERDVQSEIDSNVEPYSEVKIPAEIPLFEMSVAAGHWADVSEIGEAQHPGQIDHGVFRIRLSGDSMKPKYQTGDVVEFRCLREGRDAMRLGRDYYIQRADGTATFKQLWKVSDSVLSFHALNRKKCPKPFSVERADIVRMAVAVAKIELFE